MKLGMSDFAGFKIDNICREISSSIKRNCKSVNKVKSVKHKMLAHSLQIYAVCAMHLDGTIDKNLPDIVVNEIKENTELLPNSCYVSYSTIHKDKFVQRINFDIELLPN